MIGGTGAFGARLCDLLARDGAEVTIAGRGTGMAQTHVQIAPNNSAPMEFAFLKLDRNGPLDAISGFDVVVDAAGPFHAYGSDPYRVAKAAIAAGAHYFDLCDNADFCAGIAELNDGARAAGVCVYSGMSSVPAISSTVVESLRAGKTPLSIESAILPGNKAPRGRSVVESILDQTGQTYTETKGGQTVKVRSWSDPKTYDLGDMRRQGWRIEVPDQRLFPDHFNCPNVAFRAGLELGAMRYGLGAFSVLRNKLGFAVRPWMVSTMMFGAKLLAPFGTDKGGMVVEVVLPDGDQFTKKIWVMTALRGDGPYTPAIAVRAACRDLAGLPIGAGPALSVVTLKQVEACFTDLNIETNTTEIEIIPPFKQVLGDVFDTLPNAVKDTHTAVTARHFAGTASVTRGTGLQARIAALLFGFPPTTPAIDVQVSKTPQGAGERWVRRFGRSTFRSDLTPTARGMTERFGALTFDLDLHVRDGRLHFPVRSGRFLGIPIPRVLLPQSIASEREEGGRFHFDVELRAPTGGMLVHYRGWLEEK